ncbi:MAG: hypothetical protein DDT22_01087 [candidate division WS2 bacterium]|nr:hypothetical protein [Candidatus Lithacetigena glycinireducens]
MTEPTVLTAGDTWRWDRTDLSDYPASAWTLTYFLLRAGRQITITATAVGNFFRVSIPAATTATYPAGIYRWHAYVSRGTERFKVDEGTLEIQLNYAAQTAGFDTRSEVKKILDAIEAALLGRATADQMSYSIGGRSISKIPIAELITFRDKFKIEYQKEIDVEKIRNGLGTGKKIHVRFI